MVLSPGTSKKRKISQSWLSTGNFQIIIENKWKCFSILQCLVVVLKSGSKFVVFKSLSVCLFQRCGPHGNIANLVTMKKYLAF